MSSELDSPAVSHALTCRELLPDSAVIQDGVLMALGGVDLDRMVAAHGSPLFVIDRDFLVTRMRRWAAAAGGGNRVAFAMKALPVGGVLRLAAREGLRIEATSVGEMYLATEVGIRCRDITLHGYRTDLELAGALRDGVGRLGITSLDQLAQAEQVADRSGCSAPVLLRINPGVLASTHDGLATGHDRAPFGLVAALGEVSAALRHIAGSRCLRLVGLHCHIGSQIDSASPIADALPQLLSCVAEAEALGLRVEELCLGGGLAAKTAPGDQAPEVERFVQAVTCAAAGVASDGGHRLPTLTFEPGRSVTCGSGVTLHTVCSVRPTREQRPIMVVDGGMSDNIRPALYGAQYSALPAGRVALAAETDATLASVVGSHCESSDVICAAVPLGRRLSPGAFVAVLATGAYCFAMANNYNRSPRPAVVLVGDGEEELLVRAEDYGDVFATDMKVGRNVQGRREGQSSRAPWGSHRIRDRRRLRASNRFR